MATGAWQWNFDDTANAGTVGFPDELGADLVKNSEDGDVDGDFTNNTVDLDEDYDAIYDWNDVDDDNDGIWDFFEVDTNDDLDDDADQDYGTAFFVGTNCDDRDDDGNDQDVDGDGWFQAVWDKGVMSQGLKSPKYYDVDNDNDGVPDSEDPDDENNGVLDEDQELLPGCFSGEEQSPFDHDNDGIVDWADDDYDGDGISNLVEAAISLAVHSTTITMELVTTSMSMTMKTECTTKTKFFCGLYASTRNRPTLGTTMISVAVLVLQTRTTLLQVLTQSTTMTITTREKMQTSTTWKKASLQILVQVAHNPATGIAITTVFLTQMTKLLLTSQWKYQIHCG